MPGAIDIVTGAFGFSGRYITELLLQRGRRVRTLTGHPARNRFGGRVEVEPFNFGQPEALRQNLIGIDTVFNTYWIRYPRGEMTFERATRNLKVLIDAARAAGVRRFVHISITNASAKSSLPYFRGKGIVEHYLMDSGISYAILRPAIIFGMEDILLHNIAWMLRKFPFFMIPGGGEYHVQPIFVGDLARLAVEKAAGQSSVAIDAVGAEAFTFNELVDLLRRSVGSRSRLLHVSPTVVLALAKLFSIATRDVTLTRDEIRGLMADLLVSHGSPTAPTRLTDWLARNSAEFGARYSSEMARRT
jgi:NADH dehydrogenase